MKIITVTSQKGGSGKTTLSGHLAVEATRAGAGPVVLVDTDPQGSLSDWWNEREGDVPAFAQINANRIAHDLEELKAQGFEYAIIDTPPAIITAIRTIIRTSDLVVIPTRPSPHDLRAASATVELAENADKAMCFVVNGATPRAKLTSEAAIALSQHGRVAPVTVHNRTDFAASMIDGRTVMELNPTGKSSREMQGLWMYVQALADRVVHKTIVSGLTPAAHAPQRPKSFGRKGVAVDQFVSH